VIVEEAMLIYKYILIIQWSAQFEGWDIMRAMILIWDGLILNSIELYDE
jgi:hypothetical protein